MGSSDPYGAYDDDKDVDDMSLDEIDFITLQKAKKNSLEVSLFLRSLQTSDASLAQSPSQQFPKPR